MIPKIALLAVLVLTLQSSTASARIWYIKADGTGHAPTIQAGIDSATAGDLVLVAAGTYNKTVQAQFSGQSITVNAYITKAISLLSEGGPSAAKIDGSLSEFCILVSGVGVGVEIAGFDFTIAPESIGCVTAKERTARLSVAEKVAIVCDASPCTIHDNLIHDADVGIRLKNSAATIVDNAFENVGLGVDGTESDAVVTHNTATASFGIAFSFMDSSPQIQHNVIKGSGTGSSCRGIECASTGLSSSFSPNISDNNIESLDGEGIWCVGLSPTITANTIKGSSRPGAEILYCPQVNFSGNLLINAGDGIELQSSTGNIEHNTFDGGGIVLFGSSAAISGNIVYGGEISVLGSTPTLSCNDVYGAATLYSGYPDQTGTNGNFSLDPEFCGIGGSGNYYLQSDSPCAPGNDPDGVDCGRIGAFDTNCSTVRVRPITWGKVKALYRR